jgi:hypothetical protein
VLLSRSMLRRPSCRRRSDPVTHRYIANLTKGLVQEFSGIFSEETSRKPVPNDRCPRRPTGTRAREGFLIFVALRGKMPADFLPRTCPQNLRLAFLRLRDPLAHAV